MTPAQKADMQMRLMATFLEELESYLHAFNSSLLAMEKDRDGNGHGDHLKIIFRTAHSLKGAARSIQEPLIESICHSLEEIFNDLLSGRRRLDSDLFALAFAAVDALSEAGARLRDPSIAKSALLTSIVGRLKGATGNRMVKQSTAAAAMAPAAGVTPVAPVTAAAAMAPGAAVAPVTAAAAMAPGAAVTAAAATAPAASVTGAAATAPAASVTGAAAITPAAAMTPGTPASIRQRLASPPEAAVTAAAIPPAAPHIRVAADKLNTLLAQSGELLGALWRVQAWSDGLFELQEEATHGRSNWQRQRGSAAASSDALLAHLQRLEDRLDKMARSIKQEWRHLNRVGSTIDQEVRRIRMLPFADACDGMDRMVRDLALASGKQARVVITGGDVELDRSIHEALRDLIRHLLRNAIDHGVESTAQRLQCGKAATATITIAATLVSSRVEVVVQDDGRGLDYDALRAELKKRQMPLPTADHELNHTVFLPGLSTAAAVTEVSGRGIGLDIVKSQIESLHGGIELHSQPGKGCRFTLAVPLTLTTLQALLVTVGDQTLAFASSHVHKLLRLPPAAIRSIDGRPMIIEDNTPLAVYSLAAVLGLQSAVTAQRSTVHLLVVGAGDFRAAFIVDELLSEREVVVKNLGRRLRRLRHVSGATILPTGAIALVLNAANVLRFALNSDAPTSTSLSPSSNLAPRRRRIIVAEDSVTTRTLEKNILEAAGYEVAAVPDGEAAWQLLLAQGADLLVTDVEMPRLDGFELARTVRKSPHYQNLPIVLLTALSSDAHRALGVDIGINAYLVKNAFDQSHLLATIARLI